MPPGELASVSPPVEWGLGVMTGFSALTCLFNNDLSSTYYVPGPAVGIHWGEETLSWPHWVTEILVH